MFDILAAGFVIGLTHAMPPGPITFEVIKRGVSEGLLSALKVDLGAVAADALFFALIVIGLSQVLGSRTGRIAMWLCGCALLVFLGVRGIYKLFRKNGVKGDDKEQGSSPMAAGFLICITSPFAIVWWTGVFAGTMAVHLGSDAGSLLAMFAGIAIACLGWYALIGMISAAGKKVFRPSWMSVLSLLCSLMMLAFAAILFWRGYTTFM
ncbi:putative lysine exporter protein [Methanocella paludicola SANAE]|uniref:Lysine exporter protein n=1 Tax=Methanocella paludicola (strain DSM 17711 / JCM 13418 / NBRC 101707 / SANAE) TaxID=304371 RepID=D1YY81_METPS|nr:LysE family transporter [Methanocella paludicola]BAI61403.1 putative lysine exporter protein [Methanocella paludicola SANAE]